MRKPYIFVVCALLMACGNSGSPSNDGPNNGGDGGGGLTAFPSETQIEMGRWLVNMNTAFIPSDGVPVVAETPIYGCFDQSNPLVPFLDPERCTFEFEDPFLLPVGSAVQLSFDCQGDNGSQDIGQGTLFVESKQTFGLTFQSTMTVDGGLPIQNSVELQGQRLSECEQ